jgi:hypothetical protein
MGTLALSLLGALADNRPLGAQTFIPQPHPFPPGAAVYEWHYACPHRNPDGTCRFSILAANYSANNVADAQIVLAFQPVGSQQIPFYYFWITSMARKKPDLVMLQSNTGVSFVAQGMTLENDTGPVTAEPNQNARADPQDAAGLSTGR